MAGERNPFLNREQMYTDH